MTILAEVIRSLERHMKDRPTNADELNQIILDGFKDINQRLNDLEKRTPQTEAKTEGATPSARNTPSTFEPPR